MTRIRTDNNVPITKNIYKESISIPLSSIYQYFCNFDINKSNRCFDVDYINFGTDGIIRDIFYLHKNKKVYFEEPNYMMVSQYAKAFNMQLTNFDDCEIAYISYPNGATLKNPNFVFKKYNKTIILDLSYYIYQFNSFDDFINECNYFRSLGYYVLFGASKILGLPGLRIGMCLYENPEVFNSFHQPWQITSVSYYILKRLWNSSVINEHIKIIKESKKYFKNLYKDYIAFETDGPFLALTKEFKSEHEHHVRDFGPYYRFSIVDKDLIMEN